MPLTRYVDLDGTLARFSTWNGPMFIGPPVTKMVDRVKRWLAKGDTVVIFTSRMCKNNTFVKTEEYEAAKETIENWCLQYIGVELPITSDKQNFDIAYDDLQEHIVANTGETREQRLLETIRSMRNFPTSDDSCILNYVVHYLKEIVKTQME